MKKTIIATFTIWLIIIIAFSILGKGAVRTVKVGEKSQLWFTGIYITVLDYKRVYPSVSKKEFEPMKYIAFKVLLDGRKEKTSGDPPKHYFGEPVGSDCPECYDTCGDFFVEGDIGEKKNIQIHSISPSYADKVLGNESPIIGLGKVDSGVVEGWVLFKVPEEFEIKKFIYRYREYNDSVARVFPKVEVQVLLNEPIK